MGNHCNFRRIFIPTWLQVGGPRGSKIEAKTRKNRCWKTTRFRHRFLEGSDVVLGRFLVGFGDQKCMRKVMSRNVWKVNKTLRGRTFFWCWLLQQASNFEPKSMKNRMFFGTSILIGFWEGFGTGLGGPNHQFSNFFRCFFDVNFDMHFGRRKIRSKMRKNQSLTLYGVGFAVYGDLLGRDLERGIKTSWA